MAVEKTVICRKLMLNISHKLDGSNFQFLSNLRYRFPLISLIIFFQVYSRNVPKLMLTLSAQICNAIYWNLDHVFCSSLSFQQAPADICMSNRSRVMAGFVKTVACTPLVNGRREDWHITSLTIGAFLRHKRPLFRDLSVLTRTSTCYPAHACCVFLPRTDGFERLPFGFNGCTTYRCSGRYHNAIDCAFPPTFGRVFCQCSPSLAQISRRQIPANSDAGP